ncbi:hypothetical protein [Methylobacter sp. S3L5C]|uniref:hypothetical protein n=1 Tax=Methylobacter sp. S3L5C TaxID=2839024 RepID=UPI001FAD00C6|nr:hypothetical protein [Methylobacter sp. S3L5C]UOA07658.1 hypothetical protein KKZ03_15510 [Methylobacter sp. S3L5C]
MIEKQLPPPTLEQMDKDLLFVADEMADARDLGIALHVLLLNLIIALDKSQVIDGKALCYKLIAQAYKVEPGGAKIALEQVANEIIIHLAGGEPDATQ